MHGPVDVHEINAHAAAVETGERAPAGLRKTLQCPLGALIEIGIQAHQGARSAVGTVVVHNRKRTPQRISPAGVGQAHIAKVQAVNAIRPKRGTARGAGLRGSGIFANQQ